MRSTNGSFIRYSACSGVVLVTRLAVLALVPTVLLFTVWDVIGIVRLHWTYNPDFITGVHLGVMPLEELVFFIVIPICGLLTYEAVGTVLKRLRGRDG